MNTYSLSAIAVALLLLVPTGASAASKPTCVLTASTTRGEVTTRDEVDIFALEGETLTLSWESKNAKKAVDEERDSVDLEDSKIVTVEGNDTYGVTVSNGSKKSECSVSVRVAEASFDAETLDTNDTKPELAGEASGTKSVRIELRDSNNRKVFTSKEVKLHKGEWEIGITKSLKEGSYIATLLGEKKYDLNVLATSTLTILPKGSTSTRGGSLSVGALALLGGGIAVPGTSVPVAYIQVRNTGTASTTLNGFTLIETGSIPDEIVTGFSVNDDKGGSRQTFGGSEGTTQFKKGSVFVPLPYTLKAGELRIFTIKAILSANKRLYGNAELKINVSGVDTGAKITGALPIVGTTWMVR